MRAGLAARLACLLAVAASLARADTPTLSAGATHTCAIDASDAAHCWGENSRGQIDVPTASDAAGTPITGWRAVAASKGGCHSCGVTNEGDLLCWGCDDDGELGPPPEVVGRRWVAVAAGKGFTCAIDAVARAIWCWGRFLPKMPVGGAWDGPWAFVTAGEDFVCAVARDDGSASSRGGRAQCKGWSPFGQTEVPKTGETKWRFLSAGFQHVCGVDALGAARCWGSDLFGETNLVPVVDPQGATVKTIADVVAKMENTDDLSDTETKIVKHAATLTSFTETAQTFSYDGDPGDSRANVWGSIAAGNHWSCGVLGPMRSLACWGKKRKYEVGGVVAPLYDEYGVVSFPNDVCGKRFLVVAAGKTHACAITDERELGGLNTVSTTNGSVSFPPLDVPEEAPSSYEGGRMVCWGDSSSGKTSPPNFVSSWRAWPTSAQSFDLGVAFAPSAFAATGATHGSCGASTSSGVPYATTRKAVARQTLLVCAMALFLMFLMFA
jgi:hypothetical protein